MISRGKFHSLTLINWNGFFARTFDLDELVTTLSGGNGAGKSTTMAAFVTALIPDLTLLHFRNTTEAGATGGSRDKGLYGKLRAGNCYSILEIINSKNERIFAGIRLQQIAGKDRKIDLKPFIIQNLPQEILPIPLFTKKMDENRAQIISLSEVKTQAESEGAQFKQFNAISDYHSFLFDLGVLPKRFRLASDRSKYYRLIEASLYGGISSTITRSLRDYLLPENSGVRKAFQDMEAALLENRMTLQAISLAQKDRNLFKHLITESTNYVGADYMRHRNERENRLSQTLLLRKQFFDGKRNQVYLQQELIEKLRILNEENEKLIEFETQFQYAKNRVDLIKNAIQQQEKIGNYQEELDEIREQIEEQSEFVLDLQNEFESVERRKENTENSVDNLKSELADFQEALSASETRAIQFQQANQALENAKLLGFSDLNLENVDRIYQNLRENEKKQTESLLHLEQKINLAKEGKDKFEHGLFLIEKIVEKTISREKAWEFSQEILQNFRSSVLFSVQYSDLQTQFLDLEKRIFDTKKAKQLLTEIQQNFLAEINFSNVNENLILLKDEINELYFLLDKNQEQSFALKQKRNLLDEKTAQLKQKLPNWQIAQEKLQNLNEKTKEIFKEKQEIAKFMQNLLENEQKLTNKNHLILDEIQTIENKIAKLSETSDLQDLTLIELAVKFNGVLLSEIYDDISINDAPYFSALFGDAKNAIVIPDLSKIPAILTDFMPENYPENLYFIEGSASDFDSDFVEADEYSNAILVKTNSRQWRLSQFPKHSLFGRAAKEKEIEKLSQKRIELNEKQINTAFNLQKNQRLYESFAEFFQSDLNLAFEENVDLNLQKSQNELTKIEQELEKNVQNHAQMKQKITQKNTVIEKLQQLQAIRNADFEDNLDFRFENLKSKLELAKKAEIFVRKNEKFVKELETLQFYLQSDPLEFDELNAKFSQKKAEKYQLAEQIFAISEIIQRREHFKFNEKTDEKNEYSHLREKLKNQLNALENERDLARESFKQIQQKLITAQQTLSSLKNMFEMKNDVLDELVSEFEESNLDSMSEENAINQKNELEILLNQTKEKCKIIEKSIYKIENEIAQFDKNKSQLQKDYFQFRQLVIFNKKSWVNVITLTKIHPFLKRLYRPEFLNLSANELRSISDKSLGALRLAVANNEYLRDALRVSEDAKLPEKKITFFILVYQHLQERIRQDIVETDDPIEAIEHMEIELARLTNELNSRESKLAISAKSVANIIRKTIQREQNRIILLNQGLQSIAFGQVSSVRLNVNLRETHLQLLDSLSNNHEEHQSFFNNSRISFSEALAQVFQKLHPYLDLGQKQAQTIGEELLDYRNYLDLSIEVKRGAEGWLRAESGALSTGEAIGTGMSILVMVIQSWEDEAQRLRGKDIFPCRLLFLDEAARLDALSISTLFELCERLQMQLIIAAPENISPEKGTTYKLIRKIIENQEHVHVVGLKGFA